MKDKANKKAKPVYAVASYVAHRLPEDGGFIVTLTSVTKDGVELITDEQRTKMLGDADAAISAGESIALSAEEFAALSEEEAVAFEEAKLAALDKFRAERKDAKRAANAVAKAAKLAAKEQEATTLLTAGVSSDAPTSAEATPDPLAEARLLAFRALAKDLGVTVDKKGKKAFLPSEKDAAKAAARFALKQAARAVSVKKDAPIDADAMAKLQLAHTALARLSAEATCAPAAAGDPTGVASAPALDSAALAKALDITKLAKAMDGLRTGFLSDTETLSARVAEAKAEAARIEQAIKDLTNMPLGRPTQANARVIPDPTAATWADMLAANGGKPSPADDASVSDLLKGTEVVMVRRGMGQMKMRKWPAGHGKGARPAIPDVVKPYMLMADIIAYEDGGEALVPELTD